MNSIILICGNKNSGKTAFLKDFINTITFKKDILIAGFLAEGIYNGEHKTGFNLVNIQSRDKKLICTDQPVKGWEKSGRFYFNPDGLLFGKKILTNLSKLTKLVIIDEYGPLELSGGGWDHEILQLLPKNKPTIMMTVRVEILSDVIQKYSGHEIHVYNINQHKTSAIIQEIEKIII